MEKYIMAHEIEMINGVAQMAYAGETPWHGLGVKVFPSKWTPFIILNPCAIILPLYFSNSPSLYFTSESIRVGMGGVEIPILIRSALVWLCVIAPNLPRLVISESQLSKISSISFLSTASATSPAA